MFYEMKVKLEESNYINDDHSFYVVDYSFGSVGSKGKRHFKIFGNHKEDQIIANEFVTNKYYELYEKGYRESLKECSNGEEGSNEVITNQEIPFI
jgi:predicted DNA-binding WGR domain protein